MASPKQKPEYSVQVRRTFAAPREKVFAAWALREQLEKWMCRDVSAHIIIHHQQDIRTGGRYLMEVRDPNKGDSYPLGNSTEVVLSHSGFGTAKIREEHDRGWNGCFDVLAKVLQASAQSI
jgi:uncharacterized protein YndB with AHSA1/START domain